MSQPFPETARRKRRWPKRLGLIAAGLALSLTALEFGLRWSGTEPRTPRWFDPALGWRFYPDQVVTMRQDGVDLGRATIDAHGYRAPPFDPPHPPGCLAIAAMGDSVTFGWPVADDQTWPARLQQDLERVLGQGAARVRNFGVPGWNTLNEERQWPLDVAKWKPDLVLLAFSLNDTQPEDRGPTHVSGPLFRWTRDTALQVAFHSKVRPLLPRSWFGPAEESEALTRLRADYSRQRGQIMATPEGLGAPWWDRSTAALERLVAAIRADGVAVALIVFPVYLQIDSIRKLGLDVGQLPERLAPMLAPQQHLAELARRLDLPMLDLLPDFAELGQPPFHARDVGHPSPAGYALAANRALNLLEQQGWLPATRPRAPDRDR